MKNILFNNGSGSRFGAIHFIAIISASLSSCFPGTMIPDPYYVSTDRQMKNIYYAPTVATVAMEPGKGAGSFSLIYAGSGSHASGQIEGTYNATRHLGASIIYNGGDNNDEQETRFHQFQAGAHYYSSLNEKLTLEIVGGGGSGILKNVHYTGLSAIKTQKFFLQPALGIHNADNTLLLAFVLKAEADRFRLTANTVDKDRESYTASQLQSLQDHPLHIFLQPGMIMRFGWKGFRFATSYSYNADMTIPDLQRARHSLSAGINVPFRVVSKKDRMNW